MHRPRVTKTDVALSILSGIVEVTLLWRWVNKHHFCGWATKERLG